MQALVVLYPNCVLFEVTLASELLREHMPVVVTTPDGEDHVASNGMRIRADAAYAAVKPEEFGVVLVPGGDPESVLENASLRGLLRGAEASGALLGAICAGPLLVAKAGLLEGKRFTHGYKDLHREFLAPFWKGASFQDLLVVRDGRLVTAMAEGHVDFAIELLAALGLADEATRERRRKFYKGIRTS
jgi:putative intracellular protease/amidase